MTAGYNHLGKSDACFHPLGAVGEAHVKKREYLKAVRIATAALNWAERQIGKP
jgi:hypothetical protein